MRLLILVFSGCLVCSALAQEDGGSQRSRLRSRSRGARVLSRERLADVIGEAVSIEDSGEAGRKRVILRRPGGALRRVKLIRRPRPSARTPSAQGTTTTAPTTVTTPTEPPVTTFSPRQPVFAFTSPSIFTTPAPIFTREPQRDFFEEPSPPRARVVPAVRRPSFPTPTTAAPRRQRPAIPLQAASGSHQINRQEEVVGTIRNYSFYNEDGSFTFGYEGEDGSFKEETRGADCVVRGKYGYIDPDGVKREFKYESGNPCTPGEEDENVQFDEQGFPVLEEDGTASGFDPLDDQPILVNPNQFISQTKEEQLTADQLSQFRRPSDSRRRPSPNSLEGSPRRPALSRRPAESFPRQSEPRPTSNFPRQPEPRPTSSFPRQPEPRPTSNFPRQPEPRPTSNFPRQPEPRPTPSFPRQPEPRPTPSFPHQPEPRPTQSFSRQPENRPIPTFRPQNRTPVTFRPQSQAPVTFRPQPQAPVTFRPATRQQLDERRPSVTSPPETRRPFTFRPESRSPVTFRPQTGPQSERRPFSVFSQNARPNALTPRPQTTRPQRPAFNFDDELRQIKSRPTATPRPLDDGDNDFALGRPPRPSSGNFNHELTFDPNTGQHRTNLVQRLPEGTEIRIGETLKSFPQNGPSTTNEPPNFQNSFFQSLNNRFSTTNPPPRLFTSPRPSPSPSATPSSPPRPVFSVFNQARPQPTPQSRPGLSSPAPPQSARPPVFSVFNRPRPQPQSERQPESRPPTPSQSSVLGTSRTPFEPPQSLPQPFNIFSQPPRSQQARNIPFNPFNRPGSRPSPQDLDRDRAAPPPPPPPPPGPPRGGRPVQQIRFGTQVANPVFNRFGVSQPFQPQFDRPPPPQPGQFQPPQPINFFSN